MHLAVRLIAVVVVALGVWTMKDALLPGLGTALAMPKAAYGLVRRAMAWSGPWGALGAGVLVGMCAVPCSGALYVGVLALIASAPLGTKLGWLLLYNLMFIAPLVAVLALVANRRSLNRVAHWTIHRRMATKLAMGGATVLLGFAILLVA
jgi:cytochrome c biogenesis protein CcdA